MATTNIIVSYNAYLYSSDSNYSLARSFSGDIRAIHDDLSVAMGQAVGFALWRSCLKFNTSSLAGMIIKQVNLRLVTKADNSVTDFDVQIVKCDWSIYDPLVAGNLTDAWLLAQSSARDDNIFRNTAGISLNTQYTSGNLSTAWINTTGYTYYALQSSREYAGTTPTGNEHCTFYQLINDPESYRPTLIVEYEYPALGVYYYV